MRAGPGRLDAAEARHAATVLRLAPGDRVVVFDGRGTRADATLGDRDGESGGRSVAVETPVREPPPFPSVWLGVAAPKGKRWAWLVEKAVEAGVDVIQPVRFARGVAKPDDGLDKARAWALAAAKQCRRARLPDLREPVDLAVWRARTETAAVRLYGAADGVPFGRWAEEALAALAAARRAGRAATAALMVGPEGDFTPDERAELDADGWRAARWGTHVLRVETAAVLGVAAMRLLG